MALTFPSSDPCPPRLCSPDLLRLLLGLGASINLQDSASRSTGMKRACMHCHCSLGIVAGDLHAHGAQCALTALCAALHFAVAANNVGAIRTLVQAGAIKDVANDKVRKGA